MFSEFFIKRPVFASVISIIIVLAGFISIFSLPISEYPRVSPPQIVVSTSYPGASAETISKTVAAPLEEQINGAKNMLYMSSLAADNGSLSISVFFEIGTDPDDAKIDVNNRVQAALTRLYVEMLIDYLAEPTYQAEVAGLNYNIFEKDLNAGLFYNVQGRALQVIGIGQFPDVFTEPFHSLNFNASKRFGSDKKKTITLKVDNLLLYPIC